MEKNKETLKIAIIIGSISDEPKIKKLTELLDKFPVYYSLNVCSAHRTPVHLSETVNDINEDDRFKVCIAAAGMSAALPGCIAAQTTKPVIGLPLSSSNNINDLTALLSVVQMPPGIPVMTVGLDAAKNAALAALEIIALFDCKVNDALKNFRFEQLRKVIKDDENIILHDEYKNICQ